MDFYGLSSYPDNPKRIEFEEQCSKIINLTINIPLSEAKIHDHLIFQRNWLFIWIPILAGFFIPIISFIIRPEITKNSIPIISFVISPKTAENKDEYYWKIVLIFVGSLGLSALNLQNLLNFENIEFVLHKGLWIFIILILFLRWKDNKTDKKNGQKL